MKTISVFWDSPMPSQRRLRGIQVMDGSGRNSDTNGSMIALAGHHTPMTMPSGTATTAASANPRNTRREDASIACQSSPVPTSLPASAATARGEGRKIVETQPYSVATLQSARNAQTERIFRSRLSRRRNQPALLGRLLSLSAAVPALVVTYGFGRKLTFSHFATSGCCGIFLV